MNVRKYTIVVKYLDADPDGNKDGFKLGSSPTDVYTTLEEAQELACLISGWKNVIITTLHTPDNRNYVFESGKLRDEPSWTVVLTERQIEAILNGLAVAANEGQEINYPPVIEQSVCDMLQPFVERL